MVTRVDRSRVHDLSKHQTAVRPAPAHRGRGDPGGVTSRTVAGGDRDRLRGGKKSCALPLDKVANRLILVAFGGMTAHEELPRRAANAPGKEAEMPRLDGSGGGASDTASIG